MVYFLQQKDKKQPHGYGLKSLRYIAKKYNGTLTLSNENNWFTLTIPFPLLQKLEIVNKLIKKH